MPDPTPNPTPDPAPQDPPAPAEPPKDPAAGDPPNPDPASPESPKADEPLGEGGLKALEAEREARKELEKQLKGLAPLQKVAEALGGGDAAKGKTEIEQLNDRLSNHETELTNEREARWRAEVANEKGLTGEQAARLVGTTRDEMATDADALKALFPAAAATPGTPKPDPSQGPRSGGVDIDAQISEAQKNGEVKKVISLQNQKLAQKATNK